MERAKSQSALLAAAVAIATLATPAVASARPAEVSASFRLQMRVPLYCIIQAQMTGSVDLVDGAADLGMVREVCNRPRGHDVTASFSNLASGLLEVDGEQFAIQSGAARIESSSARARTSPWRLSAARATIEGQPIFMRVAITPR